MLTIYLLCKRLPEAFSAPKSPLPRSMLRHPQAVLMRDVSDLMSEVSPFNDVGEDMHVRNVRNKYMSTYIYIYVHNVYSVCIYIYIST